jgi:amino acid transporter
MMKKTSIVIIIVGIAITIACIVYFRPAINVADSDSMTVGPNGVKTSEWPLFIGILTTFVGVCFYFIGAAEEKKANK